jgi:hypothetical protein
MFMEEKENRCIELTWYGRKSREFHSQKVL